MDFISEMGADSNPIQIFDQWMAAAKSVAQIRESTAATLSTLSPEGEIHSRVVLCKAWSEEGFTFYSNYQSRKGRELDANPNCALLFYFDPLFRQIKISGKAVRTSRADSESYWRSRPRDSQLSQFISHQSEPVESRAALEEAWAKAAKKFEGREVPCPEHWGGYLIRPTTIEFWIGRPSRLHDTFHFEKTPRGWTFNRLAP